MHTWPQNVICVHTCMHCGLMCGIWDGQSTKVEDLNDSQDPKHTLLCRENAFVAIYALFSDNKCPPFTRFWGGGSPKGDNVTFFYHFSHFRGSLTTLVTKNQNNHFLFFLLSWLDWRRPFFNGFHFKLLWQSKWTNNQSTSFSIVLLSEKFWSFTNDPWSLASTSPPPGVLQPDNRFQRVRSG